MHLDFALSYAVVILSLLLAIGAINIYYFSDLVFRKENREKLYPVWLLVLVSLIVHSYGHFIEATSKNATLYRTLEVSSLAMAFVAVGALAKSTLYFYTFVETKNRLEATVKERTKALEAKVKELEDMRTAMLNMMDDIEASKAELETAYNELKVLDKMKEEFFSNVSHELRTPLTIIKGILDLMAGEESSKEQAELISMAKQNANRLNALVGDILYYAKMEYGKGSLNIENFNMNELISTSVKMITPMAQDNGIIIETDTRGDLTLVGDKKALYKVFSNLLSNAIKFNKNGGKVTVTAERMKTGHIKVSVSDTGIGIQKEHLKKIFTKFYQVDGSTSRKYPGTGLGLSIVKNVVEKHGGRIWVESEVGRGSKFTFELPINAKDHSIESLDKIEKA